MGDAKTALNESRGACLRLHDFPLPTDAQAEMLELRINNDSAERSMKGGKPWFILKDAQWLKRPAGQFAVSALLVSTGSHCSEDEPSVLHQDLPCRRPGLRRKS